MQWIRRLPGWVAAIITFYTSVIAFTTLFLKNIHLSATIVVSSAFIAAFCLCAYAAFSKRESEFLDDTYIHRYARFRIPALIGVVGIPCVAVVLLIWRPSQNFLKYALIGNPTYPASAGNIEIHQLRVGQSDTQYRLEVTVNNGNLQDMLIDRIALSGYDWPDGCVSMPVSYELSDTLAVSAEDDDVVKWFSDYHEGGETHITYPVTGTFTVEPCGGHSFRLAFDTALPLARSSFTSFYILIPRDLKIVSSGRNPLQSLAEIARDDILADYRRIAVSVWTSAVNYPIEFVSCSKERYLDIFDELGRNKVKKHCNNWH